MPAAAPEPPEYVYAYINTRKGSASEEVVSPPFFVEKDRGNFFVIPKIFDMEDPLSEEEKKAVQERIRAAMQNKRLVPPGPGITFGFRFVWPNLQANHGVRKSIILKDGKP